MTPSIRLALACVSLWLVAPLARADAIAQLTTPCRPPRVVGIRGHAEVCLDPPPASCPPGWRGIPGGTCALSGCAEDANCAGAERCVEVPVCFETRERTFCATDAPFDPALLAGPPRPCPPSESTYELATAPCGAGASCAGSCKPSKLCLVPGQTPAVVGNPGGEGPGGTAPRGGCAGCSAAGSPGEATLALLMMAVGTLALRRREQRA